MIAVLDALATNPFIGKKLQGRLRGYYSLRAWPYRIVYEIRQKELIVLVVRLGHRRDVYR